MSTNLILRSLFLNVYMKPETDEVSAQVTISTDPQGNCVAAIHLNEEWRYVTVADKLTRSELPYTFLDGSSGIVFTVDLGTIELYEADAAIIDAFDGEYCSLTEHQFAFSDKSAQPELGITVLGEQMLSVRQTLTSMEQFFSPQRWSDYAAVLRAAKAEHDDRLPRYERVDLEEGEAVEVTFAAAIDPMVAMQELANQFPAE